MAVQDCKEVNALDRFHVKGRGTVFIVSTEESGTFSKGEEIDIFLSGQLQGCYEVIGVECCEKNGHVQDEVGLLVRQIL